MIGDRSSNYSCGDKRTSGRESCGIEAVDNHNQVADIDETVLLVLLN